MEETPEIYFPQLWPLNSTARFMTRVLKFNSREVLWRLNARTQGEVGIGSKISTFYAFRKCHITVVTPRLTFCHSEELLSSQCICSNCPGTALGIPWRAACLPDLKLGLAGQRHNLIRLWTAASTCYILLPFSHFQVWNELICYSAGKQNYFYIILN